MQRIDLSYWYSLGESLHPLTQLNGERKLIDILLLLMDANKTIDQLIPNLTASYANALKLKDKLKPYLEEEDYSKLIESWEVYGIADAAKQFETALKAELSIAPSYHVTPKGGYNVDILTLAPQKLFPEDMLTLVPDCEYDVKELGKCLAFEVPTAAAFHLHRINEAVLHQYWDSVTSKPRPKNPNMGVYLTALKRSRKDKKVNATLTQIKDLYRNSTIHPEDKLTIEEAIELYGIILSAVSRMMTFIRKDADNTLRVDGKSVSRPLKVIK